MRDDLEEAEHGPMSAAHAAGHSVPPRMAPYPDAVALYDVGMRGAASELFSLATLKSLYRAAISFDAHEGWTLSGYIAYALLAAMFPWLIFAASLAASTIGPGELEAMTELLFDIAPLEVAQAIRPLMDEALGRDHIGILTTAAAVALWISSNAVEGFHTGFDRAYQPRRIRNVILSRLIAIGFVLLGTLVSLVMGFAVILAPSIIALAERLFHVEMPFGLGFLRYAIAAGAFATFLYLMHVIIPSGKPRARRVWPGILATLILWTAAATALSVYLANFGRYSVTYGGLAGVIVTLFFFYISGAVIIYGAEVNAAIARRHQDATPQAEG